MAISEREEQFLVACFEDGGGQGFDARAAGERLGMSAAESDALGRRLASAGMFEPLAPNGEGIFTSQGRTAARDLLKSKAKQPGYWTAEQRALLAAAWQASGEENKPYNAGAIATAAKLPSQRADAVRKQLIERGVLTDARQMRTFTPEGLAAVRGAFK